MQGEILNVNVTCNTDALILNCYYLFRLLKQALLYHLYAPTQLVIVLLNVSPVLLSVVTFHTRGFTQHRTEKSPIKHQIELNKELIVGQNVLKLGCVRSRDIKMS